MALAAVEDCKSISLAHEDAGEIVGMARDLFPDIPVNTTFETAAIERCTQTNVLDDGQQSHMEMITLVGQFRDRSDIPDVRTHDAVSCKIILYSRSGLPYSSRRSCNRKVNRFLTFSGIPHEISVPESSNLDAVRQYLRHLSRQVGSIVDGQIFTEDEFSSISRVRVGSNNRQSHFYATYSSDPSSCDVETFNTKASGDVVYEFMETKRSKSTC